MNIRLVPALLAVASLLLAGCLPQSENPLSTPATSTIDSRLEGMYVQRREKKDDNLDGWHFHYRETIAQGRNIVSPWLEVLDVAHIKGGALRGNAYRALTTHIGDCDYLSFVVIGSDADKGKVSLYSFARYEVSWSGDIRVWPVNSDALVQAIKSGKLHGAVKSSKVGGDVLITDSSARLASFVAASDPTKLFSGQPMVLYRLAR